MGHLLFLQSSAFPGVHSNAGGPLLGWNDVKDLQEGTVSKTFPDDTLPGGPHERTIVYHAPCDRCDREEDYATVWAHFEERFAEDERITAGRTEILTERRTPA